MPRIFFCETKTYLGRTMFLWYVFFWGVGTSVRFVLSFLYPETHLVDLRDIYSEHHHLFSDFFFERHQSLFWRLFKTSNFLGFDTSTEIRNIYRCMGRKHPSDSRDLWLGVSRIFCFEIQIHGFFPSLCRFHLARKRY